MKQFILNIYDRMVLVLGLTYFGLCGLMYNLAALPLWLILPKKIGARVGQRCLTLLFRQYLFVLELSGRISFDIQSLDVLKSSSAAVLAPNHPGLMDAVFIIARISRVVCIAKAKLWKNPALMGGIRLARFIPNIHLTQLIRDAATEIKSGHHILIFPEGTRTVEPPVNTFGALTAIIAKKTNAPVIPIFITYVGEDPQAKPFLGKCWSLLSRPPLPVKVRVRIGTPMRLAEGETAKSFTQRLETHFQTELT